MFACTQMGSQVETRTRGSQPKVVKPSVAAAFRLVKPIPYLVLLVLLVMASLAGCTRTQSPLTFIEYRRSGGFAGLDDHLIVNSDGEATLTRKAHRQEFVLDTDTVSRLQTLFDNAAFSELSSQYLPSRQGSDFFEYVVTYQGHTVRTMDTAVPQSLQPILELLNHIIESGGKP
jgi:hypothetical protein